MELLSTQCIKIITILCDLAMTQKRHKSRTNPVVQHPHSQLQFLQQTNYRHEQL